MKITLLGEVYDIIIEDDLEVEGEIYYDTKSIFLRRQSNKKMKAALWHELSHYFLKYYNMPNYEELAEAMARFIINVNPQIKLSSQTTGKVTG